MSGIVERQAMAVDVAEVYRNSQQREVFVYGKHTPTTRNQLYYPFWLLLVENVKDWLFFKSKIREKGTIYEQLARGIVFWKQGGGLDLILKS